MIESTIRSDVVVHRFKGKLDLRDILDARMFASNTLSQGKKHTGVLWDLREVVLTQLDEFYEILVNATVDAKKKSDQKRGFLVGSSRHRERVAGVLELATLPWPWHVFEAEEDALEWLNS